MVGTQVPTISFCAQKGRKMGFLDEIGSKFSDAMGGLGELLGADHSDTLDNLSNIWNEMTDFAGGFDSKMTDLNSMLEEKEKMISDLKGKNYDLLMAQPGSDPSDAADKLPGEDGAADYEGVTFDDLISTDDSDEEKK
uniref:Uncharacterized protein n=1 Tax=Podoviridae sp. ctNY03 TaxID=2823558 RepID=A0A8S5LAP1_9CAUD|nr:MAG TPA: hypothetical protein [Podoviridae sp. ctNY03]DAK15397.1 MAG TPA: hypothetical protein [Caudoviricetes sp.]